MQGARRTPHTFFHLGIVYVFITGTGYLFLTYVVAVKRGHGLPRVGLFYYKHALLLS